MPPSLACAGFGAICGSSIATAATMSKVAYPSMQKLGYADSLSTGVIAAGGTLGILIPPSTILVIYGIVTETNIGKLFAAGVLPGLLCALADDGWRGHRSPARDPDAGARRRAQSSWRERADVRCATSGACCCWSCSCWAASTAASSPPPRARASAPRAPSSSRWRARALTLRKCCFEHPGRERAHHGDAVHDPDRRDDVRQLRQLHDHARRPEGLDHSARACRRW